MIEPLTTTLFEKALNKLMTETRTTRTTAAIVVIIAKLNEIISVLNQEDKDHA